MSKKNRNDQVPTPVDYVDEMLNRIGYTDNVVGKVVLENSCGQGNILISIVYRYIMDAKRLGLSKEETKIGLERDIIAFETDINQIKICRERLNKICDQEGIQAVQWNILHQDFLKYDMNKLNVSYIIGNPPYITYHDIDENERKFLKEHFKVCEKGRFDYCYAFIEASINAMGSDGRMIYLIPFSIFRNRYAENLRKFIREGTVSVIDFSGRKVFPGITCSVALLIYEKENKNKQIIYKKYDEKEIRVIERNELCKNGKKWIFYNTTVGERRFGDYFNVYNGVATLLNEAFLISPKKENHYDFIMDKGKVEKSVCLPAISTKTVKKKVKLIKGEKKRQEYIIFPYNLDRGYLTRYSENEFATFFPHAYEYMKQFKTKLENRKAEKNAKWFEYGRGQVLNELWQQKLIMPMVVTKQSRVYKADEKTVPYAGYFVTRKEDSIYTLEDAELILQSEEFYQYIKEVGTPTTETSFRVSVNDIKEYKFE